MKKHSPRNLKTILTKILVKKTKIIINSEVEKKCTECL